MRALCLQMSGRASAATCHPEGRSSPGTPHSPSPQHSASTALPSLCAGSLPTISPSAGHAHIAQTQRSHRGAAWSWDMQENLSRIQSHNL